jgi:lipopolysaccharide/colanic/teichoic acid biosynthesis glycosyltransferase
MIEGSGALGADPAANLLTAAGDALQIERREIRRAIKRVADIVISLACLLAVAVLFVVIAVCIKLESPGPIFHRVRRVGHRGQPLLMLKFRKMHEGASGSPLTAHRDPRLTRVGELLARTHLDELPQLWDVLRGRMSLVGPRPEDPSFVSLYAEHYTQILHVRPGLTGLSQLAFAEERTILDPADIVGDYVGRILPQKVGLDNLYSRAYGLRMDLAVLGWTIVALVLDRPVAVHRSTGDLTLRRRRVPPREGPASAGSSHAAV